jgi:uncharacterized membrane protein YjgN (DUF898 family)
LPFLLAGCGLAYASGAVDLLMLLAMIATASPGDVAPRFDIFPIANDGLLTLAIACFVLSILVPALYVGTRLTNYSWSATRVGPHRFALDLSFGRILWLWLSNFLGIVLSLGLLIPWSRVRMARYRIERLQLAVAGSLDDMSAGDRQRLTATGDQMGEALDLDLGF